MDGAASLIAEWEDLLGRRPTFRDSLGFYGSVLEAWEGWSPEGCPVLHWRPAECRQRWERGVSLIAEAPPTFDREALEPLFAPLAEGLAAGRAGAGGGSAPPWGLTSATGGPPSRRAYGKPPHARSAAVPRPSRISPTMASAGSAALSAAVVGPSAACAARSVTT